ncbi:spore coat protein [Sediminibacillus massiliensis]|uniref:spore coat protein n=1 Tax=Sediminibacillus massiliensis TaxID=1926277 RepID=UPI0009889540|nr:spore coat protein [Sediminibacillus massiliensis]
MNQLIEKMMGMAPMTDQIIATDILIAAKAEIKNYALAITETATTEVREALVKQMEEAIDFHEQIFGYMVDKGYYFPHDTSKQMELDLKTAGTALELAGK